MREVSGGIVRGGAGVRALVATVLAVLFSVSGFLVLVPDAARACSCAVRDPSLGQEKIAGDALEDSGAVFAGKVVEVGNPPLRSMMSSGDPVAVSFRVSEVWKGPERSVLEISTAASETSCGYAFREGREYLVYASRGLDVQLCGQTKPLGEADMDLRGLGASVAPTENSLPETSGGIPSLPYSVWMAATGSVLMAAVFLLGRNFRRGD